jgi:hypothetical protein
MHNRHFMACAMSVKLTRTFDAARILTVSCIATIADTVARVAAKDTPSRFSLHLTVRNFLNVKNYIYILLSPFRVMGEGHSLHSLMDLM